MATELWEWAAESGRKEVHALTAGRQAPPGLPRTRKLRPRCSTQSRRQHWHQHVGGLPNLFRAVVRNRGGATSGAPLVLCMPGELFRHKTATRQEAAGAGHGSTRGDVRWLCARSPAIVMPRASAMPPPRSWLPHTLGTFSARTPSFEGAPCRAPPPKACSMILSGLREPEPTTRIHPPSLADLR